MEIATKSMMIVGAVMVALAVVSLGIILYQATDSSKDMMKSEMSSTKLGKYNSQFINYIGTDMTVSDIKKLYELVISCNSTNKNGIELILRRNGTDKIVEARDLTNMSLYDKYTIDIDDIGEAEAKPGSTDVTWISQTEKDGLFDKIIVSKQ